jgi:hypothetical protein
VLGDPGPDRVGGRTSQEDLAALQVDEEQDINAPERQYRRGRSRRRACRRPGTAGTVTMKALIVAAPARGGDGAASCPRWWPRRSHRPCGTRPRCGDSPSGGPPGPGAAPEPRHRPRERWLRRDHGEDRSTNEP